MQIPRTGKVRLVVGVISTLSRIKRYFLVIWHWVVHPQSLMRFIYLFGVLRRFQHCTGHITTGSWKGRGNQYIEFARVVYCKRPTNGKQLPAFPLEAVMGIEPRPQRWEARVLPLYHHGPLMRLIDTLRGFWPQVISPRLTQMRERIRLMRWLSMCRPGSWLS